jgi:predicted metal-binding membrane protein
VAEARAVGFRITPTTIALFSLAALAWAAAIARAHQLGNGTGTMGMSLLSFIVMWSLMMSAMMLPAVALVASLYAQTIREARWARVPMFVAGYLVVWALAGVPAFGVLRVVDHVVGNSAMTMRIIAGVVFVAAGIYQLTPLKDICLRHCRSPMGQLLRFSKTSGRARDLEFAAAHAGYCVGCCWLLMALFIAFGVMSVWAMVGLAAVVVLEKVARHGVGFSRAFGRLCLALAVLVVVSPRIAAHVVPAPMTQTM